MDILLTHGYFVYEDPKEQEIMRPYPPLGILSIQAYLKQAGLDSSVFDTTFSEMEKLQQHILTHKPKILGIYTNLMTKVNVLKIIDFVKKQKELSTKIILGGPEVRHHAHDFLNYGADILVLGEGEVTFTEVCEKILQGAKIDKEVKGIAFKSGAGMQESAARPFIRDIDQLPFPARSSIDMRAYFEAWKSKHGFATVSISTMRGCPYTCKWCSRAVYGQSYRRRSPELVVEEITHIIETYGVNQFWFVDDVFTVSHKWLEKFAECVEKSGVKFKYECITRADRMNEKAIEWLKRSGCYKVWIGAESGSQKVIDLMDRRVEVEKVRSMIQSSQAAGIQAGTFIMIAYPGESHEDVLATAEHLAIAQPDEFTITTTYPIKGTELYQESEADNLITNNDLNWEAHSDRDLKLQKRYSDRYYYYAIRFINNYVATKKNPLGLMPRVKALVARGIMEMERRKAVH